MLTDLLGHFDREENTICDNEKCRSIKTKKKNDLWWKWCEALRSCSHNI